ncbi:hypothetical protein COLO4_16262 [Corchorus olitorius]|uniref:Uncharacterized protein n=1 Tax=Corchorus olitorius TaxID=93759 RepID=A0A1R3JIL1_9ROSI|nr:hypothetical protein COLO4_16262 [Corchorus olitorius]
MSEEDDSDRTVRSGDAFQGDSMTSDSKGDNINSGTFDHVMQSSQNIDQIAEDVFGHDPLAPVPTRVSPGASSIGNEIPGGAVDLGAEGGGGPSSKSGSDSEGTISEYGVKLEMGHMSSSSCSDSDDPEEHNAQCAISFPGAAKCMSMFHRDAKRPSNKETARITACMMGLCRRVGFEGQIPEGGDWGCEVYWSSIPNVTRIDNIDNLQLSEEEERQCAYLVDDEQQIHSPAQLSLFSRLILAGLSPWPIIVPKVGEFPVARCDALFFDGKKIIVNARGREGLNLMEYRVSKDEYTIMNLVDWRLVPEGTDEYPLPPPGRPALGPEDSEDKAVDQPLVPPADTIPSVPPTNVTIEVAPEGMVSAAAIKAAQKKAQGPSFQLTGLRGRRLVWHPLFLPALNFCVEGIWVVFGEFFEGAYAQLEQRNPPLFVAVGSYLVVGLQYSNPTDWDAMTKLSPAEMSYLRLAHAVDGLLFAQVDFSKARAEVEKLDPAMHQSLMINTPDISRTDFLRLEKEKDAAVKARDESLAVVAGLKGELSVEREKNSSLEVKVEAAEKSAQLAHDRVGFLNSQLESLQSELDKEMEDHKNVVAAKDAEIGEAASQIVDYAIQTRDHIVNMLKERHPELDFNSLDFTLPVPLDAPRDSVNQGDRLATEQQPSLPTVTEQTLEVGDPSEQVEQSERNKNKRKRKPI